MLHWRSGNGMRTIMRVSGLLMILFMCIIMSIFNGGFFFIIYQEKMCAMSRMSRCLESQKLEKLESLENPKKTH